MDDKATHTHTHTAQNVTLQSLGMEENGIRGRTRAAHSGGYITARTCSLLGNEGTPQISNASFWKRGRENVFVQMF